MRFSVVVSLLALVLAGSAVARCGGGEPPAERAPDGAPAVQPAAASLVSRLKSLVGSPGSVSDVAAKGGSYVASLNDTDKRLLANALVAEKQSPYDVYGASVLVSLGDEKAASPAFARFVLDGGDMTGFFWSWLHGADPQTAARMYISVAEILLTGLDELTPAERERAQRFLMTDGMGPAVPAFSESAIRNRLEYLKRDLKGPTAK